MPKKKKKKKKLNPEAQDTSPEHQAARPTLEQIQGYRQMKKVVEKIEAQGDLSRSIIVDSERPKKKKKKKRDIIIENMENS